MSFYHRAKVVNRCFVLKYSIVKCVVYFNRMKYSDIFKYSVPIPLPVLLSVKVENFLIRFIWFSSTTATKPNFRCYFHEIWYVVHPFNSWIFFHMYIQWTPISIGGVGYQIVGSLLLSIACSDISYTFWLSKIINRYSRNLING